MVKGKQTARRRRITRARLIAFRVTAREYAAVIAAADRVGAVTISDFARDWLMSHPEVAS